MTVRTLVWLSLMLLYTAICGPLGVINVRLAVQRYEQPVVLPDGQHDDSGTGDITESSKPSETVTTRITRLRISSEHTSLFTCSFHHGRGGIRDTLSSRDIIL
ncbi:hypothetical protein OG21DRAFT_512299 [Imleria badia]|nr:hypothetical protein OG21DRAFT_512299 [Imleria badia]